MSAACCLKSLPSLNSRVSLAASRPVTGRQVQCGRKFSDHLNSVFPGLRFPPELACHILVHAGHQIAMNRHNTGLSFIGMPWAWSCDLISTGCHVLDSYLQLFLTSSLALTPEHDLDDIAYCTLHTYALGEHIGLKWDLGRNLHWVTVIAQEVRKQVHWW